MNNTSESSLPIACIILPTYNEAGNIIQSVNNIFVEQANVASHQLQILVVDDNSPDGTQDIVRQLQEQYQNLHLLTGNKEGLGEAYKRGMVHAIEKLDPDIIFEMDADGQHDSTLIPLFINLANHGFDLVIGSRFVLGGSTPDFSLWRIFLSRFGNFLVRYMGGIARIHDCTSGYRCIKAELIPKCNFGFLSTKGYSFQSSFLCELIRNGAHTIEVPIVFPDRTQGESKLSLYDQIEFLFNIVKIRFKNSAEFIKYCFVGGSGVAINLGIYLLLTRIYQISPELASPVGIEVSILTNFILNNVWTFKFRQNIHSFRRKLVKFHIAAGIAGVANYGLFLFLMNSLGFNDIISNVTGIFAGMFINYSINSFWTWRKSSAIEG
jgi:dolichol-phosphate mannosyltransferase